MHEAFQFDTLDFVEGRSICERGLVQCGTPNYSSESEDETENELGSASDNKSESIVRFSRTLRVYASAAITVSVSTHAYYYMPSVPILPRR